MKVGIIDCGTNTIRLLIAEPGSSTPLVTLARDLRYVRLGQGVDAERRFQPEALERTFAAVDEYRGVLAAHQPDRVRFIATSAARDVTNRDVFFAGVEARLGVTPDVISGDEEARLSFLGALAGGPVAPGPVLVSDVGGGSTELILGDSDGTIRLAQSLDVGSVRLKERFWRDDPPTAGQIAAATAFVGGLLDGARVPLGAATTWLLPDDEMFPPGSVPVRAEPIDLAEGSGPSAAAAPGPRAAAAPRAPSSGAPGTWIGVAGTNTSAAAMLAGLTVYDRTVVHNATIAPADIAALSSDLVRLTVAETMRRFPILAPLRAEVIAAGVLIVAELARRVERPLIVRETDILDGAALDLLRRSSP